MLLLKILFCLFTFWLHHAAFGILVLQPEIEPVPPAVEAQSLNHWTAREVPLGNFEDTVINTDCETCTVSGNSTGLRIRVCILAVPIAD